jgi:hypothetical protein
MKEYIGIIGVVIGMAIVILALTYGYVKWAQRYAPALGHQKFRSGIGGALILFFVGQIAWLLRALWDVSFALGSITRIAVAVPSKLPEALMVVMPSAAALILGAVLLWEMGRKRKSYVLGEAIVLLWLMGPVAALLQGAYFHLHLATFSVVQLFGWAILWTAYLALSPRCALTYGTKRGMRIAGSGRMF